MNNRERMKRKVLLRITKRNDIWGTLIRTRPYHAIEAIYYKLILDGGTRRNE
mgnify:CR=1 FL=1